MSWRLAGSLDTLRSQINAMAPNRNKASDGTIGDSAHAAVQSDHNPDANGVVKAMDVTHDPANGADMQAISDQIIASNDPRMWYIIFNRRIWEAGVGWVPYYGSNPHDKHAHFNTVHTQSLYDNTSQWQIKGDDNMATDTEVDDWISKQHYIAFGVPASAEVFNAWRPVLKNNFTAGSLSILAGIDTNAGALKNLPPAEYEKLAFDVYKKK